MWRKQLNPQLCRVVSRARIQTQHPLSGTCSIPVLLSLGLSSDLRRPHCTVVPKSLLPSPSPFPCPPPVRSLSSDESHCADVPFQASPFHPTAPRVLLLNSDLVASLKTVVRDPDRRPASSTGFPKPGCPLGAHPGQNHLGASDFPATPTCFSAPDRLRLLRTSASSPAGCTLEPAAPGLGL